MRRRCFWVFFVTKRGARKEVMGFEFAIGWSVDFLSFTSLHKALLRCAFPHHAKTLSSKLLARNCTYPLNIYVPRYYITPKYLLLALTLKSDDFTNNSWDFLFTFSGYTYKVRYFFCIACLQFIKHYFLLWLVGIAIIWLSSIYSREWKCPGRREQFTQQCYVTVYLIRAFWAWPLLLCKTTLGWRY